MIRKYEGAEELEKVMDIWLETNISAHKFISKEYWENNYGMVKEILPTAEVYIYEENGNIEGFVGIARNSYIAGIFVKSESQSKGVGKYLLDFCKNKYKELELDVFCKNTGAVSFYKKNGFNIVREQEAEDTNEQEYHMAWSK